VRITSVDGIPIKERAITVEHPNVFDEDVLSVQRGQQGFGRDSLGVGIGAVRFVGVQGAMQERIPLRHLPSLETDVEIPHAADAVYIRPKLTEEAGGVCSGKRGRNIDNSQMR
jgi:hypothetical protein